MKRATIQSAARDGITLMEVLIAIGILAVGLSSVAALLPAGGSQAKKAVMADRASSLAANALSDAMTAGIARPASLVFPGGIPQRRIVIDPLGNPGLSEDTNNNGQLDGGEDVNSNTILDGLVFCNLQDKGVFGGGAAVSGAVRNLFGQSRDDVIFNDPATDDALPTNLLIDGARGFLGRTSCLWAIESLDVNPISGGVIARLSVVLFHERDVSSASAMAFTGGGTAEIDVNGLITWTGSLPGGRSVKDVFRPGTVVLRNTPTDNAAPSLYVLRAAPENISGGVYAIADDTRLSEPPAPGATMYVTVLLDSVGLAQEFVTLEGNSEYALPTARRMTP